MSTITPHYRTVKDLLQSQSFSIDEYQREYKWEAKNIEELISDLRDNFVANYTQGDAIKDVNRYEGYFLGSIIISRRAGKNYLIDGQQRVTSLTLLLIYLYREAVEKNLPVASSLEPLIFSDNFGEPRFNLDIAERLPLIEALFHGRPLNLDEREESVITMNARYRDIESIDLSGDLSDALQHFIYWLMNKVGLIEIATDSDNYAYAIFETMNDRGKPLSPVDMLKAYLLAPIEDEERRRHANNVWKRQALELNYWRGEREIDRDAACIKAWLRSQYAESIRERKAAAADRDWELIGSMFHRWIRDNHERLKIGVEAPNLALTTEHFPFFARAYRKVLDASIHYTPGLEAIFYNAHNEFTWQNTVLLAPLRISDDEETIRRKLAATATFLDIWIMRRTVNYIRVGYSAANYAMYLLCRDIRGRSLESLADVLTEKLDEDDATFDGSRNRGRAGIEGLMLNQFSRRYIYHFLARVTAFVEVNSGKPDLFDKYVDRDCKNPCDIEHISANDYDLYRDKFESRQEFEDWRNHVAGLLLLPADVNRSYQNKTFEQKAPHYAKQNLLAASLTPFLYEHQPQFTRFCAESGLGFRPYETFGKAEQSERRALLKDIADLVWSPERIRGVLAEPSPGAT